MRTALGLLVVFGVLAGLVAGALIWRHARMVAAPSAATACTPPPAAQRGYRSVAVKRGDLRSTIDAAGLLEPEEIVEVDAQVAGRIKSLGVDPSDPQKKKTVDCSTIVQEGTILAVIDDAIYRARVDDAEATLQRAQADLAQAEAKLDQAAEEWRRAKSLVPSKAIAESDYDTAMANYRAALAGVAAGKATVKQNEVALRLAKTNFDYTIIRSPAQGTILQRSVNVGQTVGLNSPTLFRIAKNSRRMVVAASVKETDIGRVRTGMPARFTVEAYPDEIFSGTVTQIRLAASTTGDTVSYSVAVATDNSDGRLLPSLKATVWFEAEQRAGVLLVPRAALCWRPRPEQLLPELRQVPSEEETPQPAKRRLPAAEVAAEAKSRVPEKHFTDHGCLWVEDGPFVRPLDVDVGLCEGTLTEVSGDGLQAGMTVVVGEVGTEAGLMVQPQPAPSGLPLGGDDTPQLSAQDADEIGHRCPAVTEVAPIVHLSSQLVGARGAWLPTDVYGTTPSLSVVCDWAPLAEGQMFADRDVRDGNKVCVIGEGLRQQLFPDESAVGQRIRIEDVLFRITGVLGPKCANFSGQGGDVMVVAPWTAVKYRIGASDVDSGRPRRRGYHRLRDGEPVSEGLTPMARLASVDQILVKAASADVLSSAMRQIVDLLRQRHKLAPGQSDDFAIRDLK